MKKLSKEAERKIIDNNSTISMLLKRNETIYLSELSDLERRLFPVMEGNRITIPREYIRKKEEFIEQYNLAKITDNYQHQSNIAYLMQYSDLTHYFNTRFYIFGQMKKVYFYYESINLAIILEAILNELAQRYRDFCSKCRNQKKCNYLINKSQAYDLKKLLTRLEELNIINLTERQIKILENLIDIRNDIHIRLMNFTIYNNPALTCDNYNKCMLTFKKLIKSINFENIKCTK